MMLPLGGMSERDRDGLAPQIAELKSLASQLNERAAALASKGLCVTLKLSEALAPNNGGQLSQVVSVRVYEELK
jgi:hypothetical protein